MAGQKFIFMNPRLLHPYSCVCVCVCACAWGSLVSWGYPCELLPLTACTNTSQSHGLLWVVWLLLKSLERFTGMTPSVPAKFWGMCRGRCHHLDFTTWGIDPHTIWMGNTKCVALQLSGTGNERLIRSTRSIRQPTSIYWAHVLRSAWDEGLCQTISYLAYVIGGFCILKKNLSWKFLNESVVSWEGTSRQELWDE